MSQGQNKASNIFRSFWQSVIGTEQRAGNAAHIHEQLTALEVMLNKYQQQVEEAVIKQALAKLYLDSTAIKNQLHSHSSYGYLSHCTIDVAHLYESLEDFDSTLPDTIEAFRQQLHRIIGQFIAPANIPGKDNLQEAIVQYADDCIDFYVSLSDNDDNTVVENVSLLIENTIEFIGYIGGLNEQQLAYAHSFVARANTLLAIAKRNQPSPSNPRYQPSIQVRYEALKPALPEIETEIKNGTFPNGKKIKEVHLPELLEAGFSFAKINQYDYQQTVLEQVKDKITHLLDVLKTNYDNPEILNGIDFLKKNIRQWLTLPDDFRPENWVEVIHCIVKNIQFSIQEYNNDGGLVGSVQPFINKLERFLATVDNDDFKFIVAAKEQPYIYEVELPDILEPEEEVPAPASPHYINEPIEQSVTYSAIREREPAPTLDKADTQPLTLDFILEYLCFDENFGALGKLDHEHTEVIYDIYYQSWLPNRIATIIEDAMQLFSTNTLLAIWDRIKAQILDKNGVNLGALASFIIDESIGLVNTVVDFIKKTVQYIINEVFLLGKAILAFFQKLDLPPIARDLLKKLLPSTNLPKDVTLLHVIAAIPYTLYQSFVQFEYRPEVQPINVA